METGDVSPPSFPWEKMEEGAESSLKHAAELELLGWSHVDGGEWIAHTESGWLCNPSEKVYFHAERNILLPAQPQAAAAEGTVGSKTFLVEHQQHVEGPQGGDNSGGEEGEGVGDGIQSDDDSDFMLDLEDDLDAATAQKKVKNDCHSKLQSRNGTSYIFAFIPLIGPTWLCCFVRQAGLQSLI